MAYSTKYAEEINSIEQAIIYLQDGQKRGILTISECAIRMEDMTKREHKLKEKAVLEIHQNKITQTQITDRGKVKTVFQTRCDGKRPRKATYYDLIDYLYEYYYGTSSVRTDYSFHAVWEAALQNKINTEEPKQNTIEDYRAGYKSFITDAFGKKDIRSITASNVKAYIQQTTHSQEKKLGKKMSKKRLYKLKGVLNLAFEYAADPEQGYIPFNPVPKNNRIFKKNLSLVIPKPEEKAFQPQDIELIRNHLWERVHSRKYDVLGYAILFSSYTGTREAEIPSLKWEDIDFTNGSIHIHSQQLLRWDANKRKEYYYEPSTKNEKGTSQGGRLFPFSNGDGIDRILNELKEKQQELGITTEWVFAKKDGNWIHTDGYYSALYYLCKGNPTKNQTGLGLELSNNHAFRMALNSYEFIPKGLNEVERARLLGHSPEVNLKHYTFAKSDDYIDELRAKLAETPENTEVSPTSELTTSYDLKIIDFTAKEKALETRKFQGLS
jgi:integrase